jgi:hypothetical protein
MPKMKKPLSNDAAKEALKQGRARAFKLPSKKEIPDPKYLGIPNICFSLTEKNDKREKMYLPQRLERGFDDSETWSLRNTIANFILPRLIRFKEIKMCHPASLTEKKWDEILDKIIRCFKLVIEDNEEDLTQEKYKNFETGMKLFGKWFLDLWW